VDKSRRAKNFNLLLWSYILENVLLFFIAGAFGALVRELVASNKIVFPCRVDGGMTLGFIGSMFIGGFVGCVSDGSFVAAALGGYVGVSMFERLLPHTSVDG